MLAIHPDGNTQAHWEDEGIVATCRVTGWINNLGAAVKLGQDEWWMGPYAWTLDDVIAMPEPIPCRGAQGLWLVPDDVLARMPTP